MKPVVKNLILSCTLTAFIGVFTVLILWNYGPAGMIASPSFPAPSIVTPQLPPIHETFAGLKDEIAAIVAGQNSEVNPFYTEHFEPPPPPPPEPSPPPPPPEPSPPPPPPPPPPPESKQVPFRYHGFFETTDGVRKAYLRREDEILVVAVDEPVVDDWKVAEIRSRQLILGDDEGEELQLDFNREKEIEVKIEDEE